MNSSAVDWSQAIPESRRRYVRWWFWAIALMTFGVLIVGGATRLTHSGLSMVEWEPILGIIPPLSDADWQERFQQYQQFPEYQKLRQGMTLGEFKFIFFWEYLHRVLARSIGIVFFIPFIIFLVKGWLRGPLVRHSLILFGLGAMQGVMGWLMVASGLVDRPSVSHFRLAAHLSLAFLIFGYSVWLARELADRPPDQGAVDARALAVMRRSLLIVGVLLGLQIIWGAFVAGLKAGFFANTFPLMGGKLVPTGLLSQQPALANFVSNPVAVQWLHRVLGTVLGLVVLIVGLKVLRSAADHASKRWAAILMTAVVGQYVLGIITLINAVPVLLGVAHQAAAMLTFGIWIAWLQHARRLASLAV